MRGRVTHVELVTPRTDIGVVVAHELHFPSRDKQAGDFEAGKAIFETHTYDEEGQRTGTERKTVERIDIEGPDMQPFVERIEELKAAAL